MTTFFNIDFALNRANILLSRGDPKSSSELTSISRYLFEQGDTATGFAIIDAAIELNPNDINAILFGAFSYANTYNDFRAIDLYIKADALNSSNNITLSNLASCLHNCEHHNEAIHFYNKSLDISDEHHPNFKTMINFRAYSSTLAPDTKRNESQEYIYNIESIVIKQNKIYNKPKTAINKRPRIGLFGANLSVASGYPAILSSFIKKLSDHYEFIAIELNPTSSWPPSPALPIPYAPISARPMPEFIQAIQDLNLDMAINMEMSTFFSYLIEPLAARPAPIMVDWCHATFDQPAGVFDWALTTEAAAPTRHRQHWKTRSYILPHCRHPLTPSASAPPPSPVPDGPPRFGYFGRPAKIGVNTVRLWAQVLHAVPDSSLRLTSKYYAQAHHRLRVERLLGDAGIRHRVVIDDRALDDEAFRRAQGDVHVMLDAHGFAGGFTAVDALWQGVPFLSMRADHINGGLAAEWLLAAGLNDWSTSTSEEFVATAAALVQDRLRLAAFRQNARDLLRASPAMDAAAFAQEFGAALDFMIQDHQENQK